MIPTQLRWLYKLTGCYSLLLTCLFCGTCMAQSMAYNFRHLTTNDGLSNGVVKCITQDKYGYIWLATGSGICLYNGYNVTVLLHSDNEHLSAPDNSPVYIFCDHNKDIWVSFENGLYRYNYSNNSFALQQQTSGITINKMVAENDDDIYCTTRYGLRVFNTRDGSFKQPKIADDNLLQVHVSDICFANTETIYLATDSGLIVYKPAQQQAYIKPLQPIPNTPIFKIAVDANNNTWVSYGQDRNMVLKADVSFTKYQLYKNFLYGGSNMTGSQITAFFADNNNRVWVATSRAGICLYDSSSNGFKSYVNNPALPMSLSSSHVTTVFQDNKGFVWLGTEGYGLNYFDPENNLFQAITPDNDAAFSLADRWYRAVAEDKDENLWMGSMNGVVRYNKKQCTYTIWQNKKGSANQLYSNSIRSLLYDNRGYVWIGTAEGLNRYNTATKHMDFFGEKDAMPLSFYWALLQDYEGNILIGCRDGLYKFNYTKNAFEHFANDRLLEPYCNYNIISLFEDSRQRLWLGCYNKGLVMIDRKNNKAMHLVKSAADTFINNNVRSFAEDKNGSIWIATNEGLAAYTQAGKLVNYKQEQGLKTLDVCALITDSRNRLWIGSGNGLFVLDSARKQFTSFTTKDGLPCAEFNEQSAFKTQAGMFVYPTLQGLISFNPAAYKESNPVRSVYVSQVNVFNKKFPLPVNPEALQTLRLGNDQNFFSFELSSPDYGSPQRTWFAYKLEPFDKYWIYTKDRLINYTNVPGGKYIFHYKASGNKDKWNVEEKIIAVDIDTVFYHTSLFWVFIFCLFITLVFATYKYRLQQREKIYALQNKTQLLEKEKAIVQYENLKQQLNPHFLFNSLTSLRSLIRIDKQSAADFLDKISTNYRYILKSSESELVPLQDELVFAQTYIDLQQTRFGKGLQVSIKVTEDLLQKRIVPVTIQNLVDNAIKHNSLDADEPLFINIFTEDNYLVVANNLQLKENVETSNRHGLNYLISLYKYLDKRPLFIDQNTAHFYVKIPLI